jgi:predicted small lipoprotein YifL
MIKAQEVSDIKRFPIYFFAALLILSLAACTRKNPPSSAVSESAVSAPSQAGTSSDERPAASEESIPASESASSKSASQATPSSDEDSLRAALGDLQETLDGMDDVSQDDLVIPEP